MTRIFQRPRNYAGEGKRSSRTTGTRFAGNQEYGRTVTRHLTPGRTAMIHLAGVTGIIGVTRRAFDSWPSTRAPPPGQLMRARPLYTARWRTEDWRLGCHRSAEPLSESAARSTVSRGWLGGGDGAGGGGGVQPPPRYEASATRLRVHHAGVWQVAEGITDHAARSLKSVLPFYSYRSGVRRCCRTPDAAPTTRRGVVVSQPSSSLCPSIETLFALWSPALIIEQNCYCHVPRCEARYFSVVKSLSRFFLFFSWRSSSISLIH